VRWDIPIVHVAEIDHIDVTYDGAGLLSRSNEQLEHDIKGEAGRCCGRRSCRPATLLYVISSMRAKLVRWPGVQSASVEVNAVWLEMTDAPASKCDVAPKSEFEGWGAFRGRLI